MTPRPILGIGSATWDRFVMVPEFPMDEGVTRCLATAEDGGGPVATALCTLSALGGQAILLDAQGDDATGLRIYEDLAMFGIDTSLMERHGGCASAQASILVRERDGARHICFMPATCPELSPESIPETIVQGASLLHLNGRHEAAARRAALLAKAAGVPVSFDGGAGRWRESLRDLVLASDVRIVAKDFALRFTNTDDLEVAACALRADSPALVVITDGVRGSWVFSGAGECFHEPAFPVSPVVDTTGCGDVFHGAFLHGWLQRWSLRETASFAAKLAAKTALGLGGRCALRLGTVSAL
ncbi:MAG: carbohydrate kinase family protein [Roseimicrobium sp.]